MSERKIFLSMHLTAVLIGAALGGPFGALLGLIGAQLIYSIRGGSC